MNLVFRNDKIKLKLKKTKQKKYSLEQNDILLSITLSLTNPYNNYL